MQSGREILWVEWSYGRVNGKVRDEAAVLKLVPENVFELSVWLEVAIIAKVEGKQIPEEVVFYLYDQGYKSFLSHDDLAYKLQLANYILMSNTSSSFQLLNNIEQHLLLTLQTHRQTPLDKQTILEQWLRNNITLEFSSSPALLSPSLLKHIPHKPHKLNDISLLNLIVRKLAMGMSLAERKKLIQYLMKENHSYLCTFREYILSHAYIDNVEFYCELLVGFNAAKGVHAFTHKDKCMVKLFMRHYHNGTISHYPCFETIMLESSVVRCVCLHEVLYFVEDGIEDVEKALKAEDRRVMGGLCGNPKQVSAKCIRYYLKESDFKVPKKAGGLPQIVTPLYVLAIRKDFWSNYYHRSVLSFLTWILLDNWLSYVKQKNQKMPKAQFQAYRLNLQLVIVQHFLTVQTTTFLNYYPLEMKQLMFELVRLKSFATLILDYPSAFMKIHWFSYVLNSELKNVMAQEDGIQLTYKIITQMSDFQSHFGEFILWYIENKVTREKLNSKQKKWMHQIAQFYIQHQVCTERATHITDLISHS